MASTGSLSRSCLIQSQQQPRNYHATNATTKDYPMHTLLPFPALSPTMEQGTISEWQVKEGDSFSAGSVLCSIETDKATMDFEAQDDGLIVEGYAATEKEARKIIAFVRKTALVPVEDRLKAYYKY